MSEPVPATHRFSPDFDDADADLIIASADGIHFRVHKLILGKASSVFLDMFPIPSPPGDAEGPQTVRLTESSWLVEAILRMCYPMKRHPPSSLSEAIALLNAGRKYNMDVVVDGATSAVISGRFKFGDVTSLESFAFGVHIGDRESVKRGVVECLRKPLSELIDEEATTLKLISGSILQSLFRLHRKCTRTAITTALAFTWPTHKDRPWCSACQNIIFDPRYSNKRNLKWYDIDELQWSRFREEFRRVLESQDASPLNCISQTLPSARYQPPPCTLTCPSCSEAGSSELMKFVLAVEKSIEAAVMEDVRSWMECNT